MSWLRASEQKPDFTSLQIQTSTSSLSIPIVWGVNKLSANLIWYANFQTQSSSGGKGGLFGGGAAQPTYSADLIMALCEGPVAGIGYIWRDQSTYSLAGLGLSLFNGTTPQATWGYLAATYPAQALAYQGSAYVCAPSYQLGSSANVGNHNFELQGILYQTGINAIDADPALVIYDFLTNAQYGAGLNPASINLSTLYGSGGDGSLETYCRALGIALSPCLTSPTPASSILTRWLQLTNCAAVWSQGELKFIPYGDTPIAAGNTPRVAQTAVPTPSTTSAGGSPPPYVIVCAAAAWVSDGGVTYTFTGSAFTYTSGSPSEGQYTLSPNGTYVFSTSDEGQAITISFTCANAYAFQPNLTPIYALTDLDFINERTQDDPLTALRVDPYSLPNIVRLECLSRSNQYASVPVEARDQSQIELYGMRVGSTIQAHEVCDELTVGPVVAQAILQRGLYVRARYQFKLGIEFCLLDPMDIVQISDANLGLTNYAVRIVSIEEDETGMLAVEAEELTTGVSTPALYANRGANGYKSNQSYPADAVNATPLIYEPPPPLTNGSIQLWIGASGGVSGVCDPNWGGAYVYVSLDDISYTQVAALTNKLRQGVLTASFAAGGAWDTINTLGLDVAESAAILTGASEASAQAGATLCVIDGELLAYENAALTAPWQYNLSNLARGLYGTTPASHASGAAFYRLDNTIFKYALSGQYVGQTLYFKFQSFNAFGSGLQSLATCAVYTYVPVGAGVSDPIAAQLQSGVGLDLGSVSATPIVRDDFGLLSGGATAAINLGTVP